MTYHFRTVGLKVTEVQMLQLTPYAGLTVTERGVMHQSAIVELCGESAGGATDALILTAHIT